MSSTPESDPWSVSEAALYHQCRRRFADDEPTVLATIVNVEGSAYRRPGAKMLISPGEESLGAITAGCLEGPVVDVASQVLEEGQPRIETFDLMDDSEWGLGLGCNGIIDILLEPVDRSIDDALDSLESRNPVTLLTAAESNDADVSVGDRTIVNASGNQIGTSDRKPLPTDLVDDLKSSITDLRRSGGSTSIERSTDRGSVTVFVDYLEPIPRLLLFGSQNDIQPVSRIGRDAGFEVIIASSRGAQSSADDFPHAHDVLVTHPTNIADHADELTYAVLMSHNLIDDRLALESLLTGSNVPYIGLMGPRERFEEIREGLTVEGTTLTEDQLERISTPVGLDLGGGEPVQIALSIVSEALAVYNDCAGGRLKNKEGPIHERVDSAST